MTDRLEGGPRDLSGVPDPARGAARSRFFVIQAVRLSGVAMAIAGAMILAGKIGLPEVAGYALFIAGVIEAAVVPTVLACRWKSGCR